MNNENYLSISSVYLDEVYEAKSALEAVRESTSWKFSAPIRFLGKLIRKSNNLVEHGAISMKEIHQSGLIEDQLYFLNPDVLVASENGTLERALRNYSKRSRPTKYSLAEWHFFLVGQFEVLSGFGRLLRVRLGDIYYDFEEHKYRHDFPDVDVMVKNGLYPSGLYHFVNEGAHEICSGLRSMPQSSLQLSAIKDVNITRLPSDVKENKAGLVIYSHWDESGEIKDYVTSGLRALSELGNDICFVTNVSSKSQLLKLESTVHRVLVKNNSGRDFGSWALAINEIGIHNLLAYETVTLTNDSIYFPVFDPSDLIQEMKNKNLDLWSLTDSFEGYYHLQSFYLVFNHAAIKHLFPWIVDKVFQTPNMSRTGIIFTLEIGLTREARKKGLSTGASFSIEDFAFQTRTDSNLVPWAGYIARGLKNINPTHFLWDVSIEMGKNPSLKRDLLVANPNELNIKHWPKMIKGPYLDSKQISSSLRRTKTNNYRSKAEYSSELARPLNSEQKINKLRLCPKRNSRLAILTFDTPNSLESGLFEFVIQNIIQAGCDVEVVLSFTPTEELLKTYSDVSFYISDESSFGAFDSLAAVFRNKESNKLDYESIYLISEEYFFPLVSFSRFVENMKKTGSDVWSELVSSNEDLHLGGAVIGFESNAIDSGLLFELANISSQGLTKSQYNRIIQDYLKSRLASLNLVYSAGLCVTSDGVPGSIPAFPRDDGFAWSQYSASNLIRNQQLIGFPVDSVRYNLNGINLPKIVSVIDTNSIFPRELLVKHIVSLNAG